VRAQNTYGYRYKYPTRYIISLSHYKPCVTYGHKWPFDDEMRSYSRFSSSVPLGISMLDTGYLGFRPSLTLDAPMYLKETILYPILYGNCKAQNLIDTSLDFSPVKYSISGDDDQFSFQS